MPKHKAHTDGPAKMLTKQQLADLLLETLRLALPDYRRDMGLGSHREQNVTPSPKRKKRR